MSEEIWLKANQDLTLLDELPPRTMRVTMGAHVETVEAHSKHYKVGGNLPTKDTRTGDPRGTGTRFTFYSDEPPVMGGHDEAPQPLTYVAAGVGF